ncbi:hypothetical protein CDV36_014530 [Fusarium kuroshium]|uniref:Cupin 2 conserved barrel domain-containing protein n=1 Tax=Fusarium kuroshium TaxID=2010991 RepID=A0A3M2RHP1_9HYPO|nr:hypothetical protein CDV36_014530 [Fusarium kuroshium]
MASATNSESGPAPRKYPQVRGPGVKQILVDDEVTRVTYFKYEDGEGGGVHTHEYPHLVVMFNDGPSRSIENGQTVMLESQRMNHVLVPAGKTHEVWNESGHTQHFLEIDFKDLPK